MPRPTPAFCGRWISSPVSPNLKSRRLAERAPRTSLESKKQQNNKCCRRRNQRKDGRKETNRSAVGFMVYRFKSITMNKLYK